jgi:hypothetical protein
MHNAQGFSYALRGALLAAGLGLGTALVQASESGDAFLPKLINSSTIPANGDAVNADVLHPSEIVEFTTGGEFVREYDVDSTEGGAFGLDTLPDGAFDYAVIDDVTNNLSVSKLRDR